MQIYRIGDSRHTLWDGTGAALVGGRWNSPGRPAIYGSLSYACSMLEILVHANIGRIPKTHCYVVAEVPLDMPIERHDSAALPLGWDGDDSSIARRFGDQWLAESRSAVLVVPSIVAKLEWNAVVNPLHPAAGVAAATSGLAAGVAAGVAVAGSAEGAAGAAVAAAALPLPLKSVAYQPEPLSWNPAAVNCLENDAFPQAGQSLSKGSEIFCNTSLANPQASHL